MSHQMLQAEQVAAVLQEQGREAVPKLIWCQLDAALLTVTGKRLVKMRDLELVSLIVWEKPIVPFVGLS